MWWSLHDAKAKQLNRGDISATEWTPPDDSDRSWAHLSREDRTYPKADIVYTSLEIGCFSSGWLYLRAKYCEKILGSVSGFRKDHPNAYLRISFGGGNNCKHVKLSDFESIAKSFKLLHLREKVIGGHVGLGVGSSLALGSLIAAAALLSMGAEKEPLLLAGGVFLIGMTIIFAGLSASGYSKNLKAANALNTESKRGDWTFFTKQNIEEKFKAKAPTAPSTQ